MTPETKSGIQTWSAVALLAAGVALSVAGFIVPPLGEISDSVLWFFGQCLIYAGSIFGVSIYVSGKFSELKKGLPGIVRGIENAVHAEKPAESAEKVPEEKAQHAKN